MLKIHGENRKERTGEVKQQGKDREQHLHESQQSRGGVLGYSETLFVSAEGTRTIKKEERVRLSS